MKTRIYPRVSTSVSKLGAAIATVNLPAVITCREDAPCYKQCYARRGNFAFKGVKGGIQKNLDAYLENPKGFFNVIDAELNMIPYKYFRWHSSGDIVNEQYLDLMCKLARKHKGTNFLCFTKKYELVNTYLDTHRKPSNLSLVLSNWDEWKCDNPHNLPTSYVKFNEETEIPKKAFECKKYCGDCVNTESNCWNLKKGQSVYFKKH